MFLFFQPFSLYKGLTPPLVGLAIQNAILFGLQGQFRKFVNNDVKGECIAGALTGASQALITSPIELAKIKLQLQGTGAMIPKEKRKYKGPIQTIQTIYKERGIQGCFRGLVGVLLRDVPCTAVYFGSFAYLNQQFIPKDGDLDSLNAATLVFTGGVAGMCSWASLYPVDIVKTRIQAEGLKPQGRYYSYMDCIRVSFKEEGYAWLTKGFGATMLRAFPVNAAILSTVTLVLRYVDSNSDIDTVDG